MKSFIQQLSDLYSVFAAAKQTLRENLHLTDGENCTLFELRNAVEKVDPLWRDEQEAEQKTSCQGILDNSKEET